MLDDGERSMSFSIIIVALRAKGGDEEDEQSFRYENYPKS